MDEFDIEYSGFVNPYATDRKYMVSKDKFKPYSVETSNEDDDLLVKLLSDPNVAYFSAREDGHNNKETVEIIIHYNDGTTLDSYPAHDDPEYRRNPYKRNYLRLNRHMFKNPENPGVYEISNSLRQNAARVLRNNNQVPPVGTPERDIYDRAITAGRRRKVKRRRTKRKLRIPKRKSK
jgi:hypothetical protein